MEDAPLSSVFAVGLAAFTLGVLLGGRLADAIAPRLLALVTAGGVVAGLGTAAFAPSLAVLLIGFGVVLGGATGIGYATAVRVAGTVSARRGRTVALVVSAYAAGAVVLAPIAAGLLATIGRAGMFVTLAAGLGVALLCAAALLPAASPGCAHSAPAIPAPPPHGAPVPALWLMFSLGSLPALVVFAHANAFIRSTTLVVVAVALLNAGNFFGRLVAGPIADAVGHRTAIHGAAALLGAATLALLPSQPWVALPALFALGSQYGALSVLTPVATADTVPAARFGTTYGLVFSGWGVAGLAGPVAAALLAAHAGHQAVVWALVGVAVIAWCAAGWATRRPTGATAN